MKGLVENHSTIPRSATSVKKIRRRNGFLFAQSEKVQSRHFKDLGLQGLSEACDDRSTFLRRFFWGSLWLLLLACCITQLAFSLKQYISNPTTINIRSHKQSIVSHPCITLCPSDDWARLPMVWQPLLRSQFGNISYNTTKDLLLKTGLNVSKMWNMSRLVLDTLEIRIDGVPVSGSIVVMEKSELKTISGICLTFKPVIQVPCTGKKTYLVISGTGESPNTIYNEYLVIFHSEAQIPLLRYLGPLASGVFIPFKKEVFAMLHVEEEINVNSWNKPCVSEAEHYQCEAECLEKQIRSSKLHNPCRLPFMKEDPFLPICSQADNFSETMSIASDAINHIMNGRNKCNCFRACRKMKYKEDYFIMNDNNQLLSLLVAFPKCKVQVIKEEYTYDTTNFISDIGGALGLYLGMSILSIVGIIEILVSKLWNSAMRKTSL